MTNEHKSICRFVIASHRKRVLFNMLGVINFVIALFFLLPPCWMFYIAIIIIDGSWSVLFIPLGCLVYWIILSSITSSDFCFCKSCSILVPDKNSEFCRFCGSELHFESLGVPFLSLPVMFKKLCIFVIKYFRRLENQSTYLGV